MRICKVCGVEKSLNEYTSYKNYPTKFRYVCKECENEKAKKRGRKLREELDRLNTEEEEIIREFNTLKLADKILELLIKGYDVSWSGKDTIIFNKGEKTVHAKHATKEMYNLIFARYCIEVEKRFLNSNLMQYTNI